LVMTEAGEREPRRMTSFRRNDGEVRLPWESTVRRWGCLHMRMRSVFVLRARAPIRASSLSSYPGCANCDGQSEHERTGGGWIVNSERYRDGQMALVLHWTDKDCCA
jgi:hypothetical protein